MEPDRSIMRETTRDFQTYYSPMLHGEVRLDTNTNVLGSNPAAAEYLRTHTWDLNGYPDTYSRNLRNAIGELYGVDPDCVIAGNGSDEMIDVIFKTFTNWGDNSVVPVPSYSLYDYFVRMNGGKAIPVDLTEDFQLDAGERQGHHRALAQQPHRQLLQDQGPGGAHIQVRRHRRHGRGLHRVHRH